MTRRSVRGIVVAGLCALLLGSCSGGGSNAAETATVTTMAPLTGATETTSATSTSSTSTAKSEPGEVFETGIRGSDIEAGSGAIWVEDHANTNAIYRIDPKDGSASEPVPVGRPCGLAVASGSVWVADLDGGRLVEIDAESGEIARSVNDFDGPCEPVVGGGFVWVPVGGGVARFDPRSGDAAVFRLRAPANSNPDYPLSVAYHGESLWVAPTGGRRVLQLDPRTGSIIGAIKVPALPGVLAAGRGALWLASEPNGILARLDPRKHAIAWTAEVDPPARVLEAFGSVWTTSYQSGTFTKVGRSNGRVEAVVDLLGNPNGVTATGGRVWVMDTAVGDLHGFDPDDVS